MVSIFSELLAIAHIPLGAFIIYKSITVLRVTEDAQARFGIECVLAIAAAVVALRLTDYTIPMDGDARYISWRSIVSLIMLTFIPLLNALARSERRSDN